jgi:hypothetical protein
VTPKPVPAPAVAVAAVPPVGDLSLQKIKSLWQNVRTRAESGKPSVRAGLSRATVESFDGTALVLRAPDPAAAAMLKENLAALRAAIEGVTGRALEVRIAVDGGRNPATAAANGTSDPVDADELTRYAFDRLRPNEGGLRT